MSGHAAVVFVDDDNLQCRTPHRTIQQGIDAAGPGDTVLVCQGVYAGGTQVDKDGLKIRGVGAAARVVGSGPGFGLLITASNVQIEGLEIAGFPGQMGVGIRVVGASGVTINRNNLHDNGAGLFVSDATRLVVRQNNATDNNFYGVFLENSNGVTVEDNNCSQDGFVGILLDTVVGGTVGRNTCRQNGFNGILAGVESEALRLHHNNTSDNEYVGIVVQESSDEVTVDHNICNRNKLGIVVRNSAHATVEDNVANDNILDPSFDPPPTGLGIAAANLTGSAFARNSARGNGMLDLLYQGPSSGNTFTNNRCGTALPSKEARDCK